MENAPIRIQLSRAKGWRMPENTVKVDRSTRYGNPFTLAGARDAGYKGTDEDLTVMLVGNFREWLMMPLTQNLWWGEKSEAALKMWEVANNSWNCALFKTMRTSPLTNEPVGGTISLEDAGRICAAIFNDNVNGCEDIANRLSASITGEKG